jgi:hypothetical protein
MKTEIKVHNILGNGNAFAYVVETFEQVFVPAKLTDGIEDGDTMNATLVRNWKNPDQVPFAAVEIND